MPTIQDTVKKLYGVGSVNSDLIEAIVGHWLDMVYLPPRGNFVDHIFLKAQCLARILQHLSPLTMAALS